jgi:hypothetical protein
MYKARHLRVRAFSAEELTNPRTCPPEVKVLNAGAGLTHIVVNGVLRLPIDNGTMLVLTEDGEAFRIKKNEFKYFFIKIDTPSQVQQGASLQLQRAE